MLIISTVLFALYTNPTSFESSLNVLQEKLYFNCVVQITKELFGKDLQKMGFFPKVGNLNCKKSRVFLKIEKNGVHIRIQREKCHQEVSGIIVYLKKVKTFTSLLPTKAELETGQLTVTHDPSYLKLCDP